MRRGIRWALAVVVLVASAGAGVGSYLLSRDGTAPLPQISAYSRGHTERVGPYFYCSVVNLDDCVRDGTQGSLRVDERDAVQVSVDGAIARAPWRLLKVYADERDTTTTVFRPGSRLAATVPTRDPQRGRVVGVVVQVMTLVRDERDDLFELPHAEWSVRLDWS